VGLFQLWGAGVVQAKDRIAIGVLFSTTGPYATLGREGYDGALTAISEINHDDVYPFGFRAEIRDPAGNTEAYAGLCHDIIATSDPEFVVGCTTSWSRKEVIPVLEKTGTHLWYPCPYEGFEANDHVVYMGACPNQHVVPLLDYILPRYGLSPALVGSNYIWGWETNRIARELVERAGGAVKTERFVRLGDTDIGHIIGEIRQKQPDFIFNTLIGPSSHAFVDAYHELGRDDPSFAPERRPIVSCNWTEDEVAALGERAVGHYSTAPYFQSLATPANADLLATAARFAGHRQRISAFFVQAYTAVHVIARGIAATGGARAEAVLAHSKATEFASPLGALRIHAETNHAILTPHIGRAFAAGGFEIVSEAEAPVIPDPYLIHLDQSAASAATDKRGTTIPYLRLIK
jgi:branched-chain amino acid transport system substrate-binding protein